MASILIVDDEEDIRFVFKKFLSSKGFEVVLAEKGSDALEIYNDSRPDITIMDSRLPDMDGLDVTRMITEKYPDAKILGATGYSDRIGDFMEAGATKVLPKPFSLDELIKTINEMLED